MADPLSIAAGIVGVIQGFKACWDYYEGVKGAKSDIGKLKAEIGSIEGLIKRLDELIKNPKYHGLSENGELKVALGGCLKELEQLHDKLDSQKEQSRFRYLKRTKWPFVKTGVVEIVNSLERWKASINTFLIIDHTETVRNLNQKFDLAGLPIAEGAGYKSFEDRHEPECLPGTRSELQERIAGWADAPPGASECIFWLSGVAGTGKSTISRTIAKRLEKKGQLGASFFFRRGEKDRGRAARLFTTIAFQLAHTVGVGRNIQRAIEADPGIPKMNIAERFEKLILQPLSGLSGTGIELRHTRVIILIDALDECDDERDQEEIVFLLSRLKEVKSIEFCVFLTSRPELPIRDGFKSLFEGCHQDVVLHEVHGIDRDIRILLNDEFSKIRAKRELPKDWPGDEDITKLVQIAVPLFIFAKTACRFIADENWDAKEQLGLILEYQADLTEDARVEQTYLPVLKRFVENQNSAKQRDRLAGEFREIVGSILTLASPLSIPSLAKLLSVPETTIDNRLKKLHSVLNIPMGRHDPVRTFHLSFRDFLVSPRLCNDKNMSQLWINEKEIHKMLATKCIEIMSNSEGLGLKQDICRLELPGILRSEIHEILVQKYISPELQYACRYWVYHLTRSGNKICDDDQTHRFLERRLLHWLEAESILGDLENTIQMAEDLRAIVDVEKGEKVLAFLYDLRRFLLQNRYIIDRAPLQTYISAIIFTPEDSIVRKRFDLKAMIPWIRSFPKVQRNWGGLLQSLEGHKGMIKSVAVFDGVIASSCSDRIIRLWNSGTGAPLRTIEGDGRSINSLAFRFDGVLASVSVDGMIKLWNIDTGRLLRTLEENTSAVEVIRFSAGDVLGSGSSGGEVILWDTGSTLTQPKPQVLEGHTSGIQALEFFNDILASGSDDRSIRLWKTDGTLLRVLKGHTDSVRALAFSSDGTLVSGSIDKTIKLWNVDGTLLRTLEGHTKAVVSLVFLNDRIVSGSWDNTFKYWSMDGTLLQTVEFKRGGTIQDTALASGGILVLGDSDFTIRLWDLNEPSALILQGHTDIVGGVAFSSDGKILASASRDKAIKLWSGDGRLLQTIMSNQSLFRSIAFSSLGNLASASDDDVKLYDTGGTLLRTINTDVGWGVKPIFSPDGNFLAYSYGDGKVGLLNISGDGDSVRTLEGHIDNVVAMAFSPDGEILAVFGENGTIKLWGVDTGDALRDMDLANPRDRRYNYLRQPILRFSLDGGTLMSTSRFEETCTVNLWDSSAGVLLQEYTDAASTLEFASHVDTVKSWPADVLASLRSLAMREMSRKPYSSTESPYDKLNQPPKEHEQHHIIVENEWVSRGRQRIWLPPNYRPYSWAIYGNRVALGCKPGTVWSIEFEP
ncbi:hypothetical protein AOL_s00110g260 [Orbilia oligospora ATCC 24927]|uniref:Nephrocystin 3-like N-terminal domain-containing protein n=1 Tax=Arthrobotrys oligospora (strain ATCC 24927 / CBS 115.81 / DSM 1491) TaxID=756982 RepID=G1XL90_ARTOA|nr:hypothetical protein AOL_s00110g260 [Orbilia oligospora ATCC 24927]EGX46096.1 hypothetical protein AOL_s00110g260 [Orbilia oligospora ATCC 24927]